VAPLIVVDLGAAQAVDRRHLRSSRASSTRDQGGVGAGQVKLVKEARGHFCSRSDPTDHDEALQSANTFAGVIHPKVCRGRLLSSRATARSWARV
jgi:hypothetical protein